MSNKLLPAIIPEIVPDTLPEIVKIERIPPSPQHRSLDTHNQIVKWIRIPIPRRHIFDTIKRRDLASAKVPVQMGFRETGVMAEADSFQIIKRNRCRILRFRIRIPNHTPGQSLHLKLKIGLDQKRMKAVPEFHLIDNRWTPIRVGIAPPRWATNIITRIPMGLRESEPVPALEAEVAL